MMGSGTVLRWVRSLDKTQQTGAGMIDEVSTKEHCYICGERTDHYIFPFFPIGRVTEIHFPYLWLCLLSCSVCSRPCFQSPRSRVSSRPNPTGHEGHEKHNESNQEAE